MEAMRLICGAVSIEGWQKEISRLFASGHHCTLDLARAVHEARSTLAYGQWAQLWEGWKPSLRPFPKRKGEMLALIGRHLGALNAQDFAHLPRALSILYFLAKLPAATLQAGIQDGRIHPKLKLKEAESLFGNGGQSSDSPRSYVLRWLGKFCAFVYRTFSDWSPEAREEVRAELARLLTYMTDNEVESNKPLSSDFVGTQLIQGVPFQTPAGTHAANVGTSNPAAVSI